MLPIEAVLPDIRATLRDGTRAVLVAPPGAGKTTMVAPALLNENWCTGEILLLSPRRLAARAAAERMASLAGEPVGKTYGYATRMDAKRSAATRVTVLTEGIFRNRILADPELPGVSAVLFDEVHERSLDSDFGLALALEAQAAFRPDLRLVAMSATLDGTRFATLMDAPVIESEGRAHPLTLRHLGRGSDRIEDDMATAIRQALREEPGDLLAFLPGVAEISRTAERLTGLDADIIPLHGTLRPEEQRAALGHASRRKVILATSIAETSLTIDGVRIVVDSGLARRPRYDRGAGVTRLVTERASQASVTQRAGRSARQSPGVAYRLWEEAATAGLPRFDPPEILEADLSSLVLDCAIWGEPDPRALRWLDPPPAAAVDEARKRLTTLDAIDAEGRPTAHGEAVAKLPLPPRLAHMLVLADDKPLAAKVAMLLSERGLGGNDTDLEDRLRRWNNDRGQRAESARRTAARWASLVSPPFREGQARSAGVGSALTSHPGSATLRRPSLKGGEIIALAFPDRISRRRSASGEDWLSTGGRGFRLDPASSLAKAEWLAVAEVAGQASGARILSAAQLDTRDIDTLFADRIETRRTLAFDPATGSVSATRDRRLGAIVLKRGADEAITQAEREAAMLAGVRQHGVTVLRFSDGAQTLRARASYAGLDLSDESLIARFDDWLPAAVSGQRHLPEIKTDALLNLLDWPERQQLDARAPRHFSSPAGTTHQIDYAAEGGPRVELRVQALFGLDRHPMIGTTPLVLSLTSPAGRPIQTTRDLPAFWRGSWADVAKEMRGRYPRHNWPDDPTAAPASLKTKKALGKG
jgi:ATP-dependent helicase HrpB